MGTHPTCFTFSLFTPVDLCDLSAPLETCPPAPLIDLPSLCVILHVVILKNWSESFKKPILLTLTKWGGRYCHGPSGLLSFLLLTFSSTVVCVFLSVSTVSLCLHLDVASCPAAAVHYFAHLWLSAPLPSPFWPYLHSLPVYHFTSCRALTDWKKLTLICETDLAIGRCFGFVLVVSNMFSLDSTSSQIFVVFRHRIYSIHPFLKKIC